jgi:hypothetical protein
MADVFNLACISNKRYPIYEMNSKSAFESEEMCLADYSENKNLSSIMSIDSLSPDYLAKNPQDVKLLYHLNHEILTSHNFELIYPGGIKKNSYYSQFSDDGVSYNDLLQQKFLALDMKSRHNLLKAAGELLKA